MSGFQHIQIEVKQIAGHTFRVIKEPLELPYLRMAGYYMALYDMGRKASTADLMAFVDEMKKALNTGNIADAGFLINALDANLQLYTSFSPIFDMASCLILVDDEPFEEIPMKFHQLKDKLCRENEEVMSFFLSTTLASFQSMNKDLDITQIQTYLSAQEHRITTETFLDAIDTLRKRTSPSDLIRKHYSYPRSAESSEVISSGSRWQSIIATLKLRSDLKKKR